MVPGDIIEWAKAGAIAGGVIVGIYAVYSPAYVWHRRQMFGWGGGVLCGFGTVLIVASIFHTVTFTADVKSGLELRLANVEGQLKQTNLTLASLDNQIAQASVGNASVSAEQITRLQRELKALGFSVHEVQQTSNAALSQVQKLNTRLQTDYTNKPSPQEFRTVPFDKKDTTPPNFGIDVPPKQ